MIKIGYPKDWVYNAGVIGLLRVLGIHSKEDLEFSGIFNEEDDSIIIDENLLDNFTDKYFDSLAEQLNTVSTFSRIKKAYYWLVDNRVGNEDEEDFLSTYNDRLDKFIKISKSYYERRGVSSILDRFNKEDLYSKVKSLKPNKAKTLEDLSSSALSDYLNAVKYLIDYEDSNEGSSIKKADGINSYLASFLGGKFTFTKGGKNTQYFEKSYEQSVMEPLLDYLKGDIASYRYQDSFTGEPMQYWVSPSSSTHGIASRSSSILEGVYYVNKGGSTGWDGAYDFVSSPVTAWLLSLLPLGMTSVGNVALFINNTRKGLVNALEENEALSYSVKSLDKPTFGKEIRELIDQSLTSKRNGDNIIYVEMKEGKVNSQSLSSQNEKKLNSKSAGLLIDYYYTQNKEWHNVYDELVKNIDNLESYVTFLIHQSIESPDDFRFSVGKAVKIIMEIDTGKKGIDVQETYDYGSKLARAYVRIAGNDNKVNKMIYRLLKSNNSEDAISSLENFYAYSHMPFPYYLYKWLSNEETYQTAKNGLIAGILSTLEKKEDNE